MSRALIFLAGFSLLPNIASAEAFPSTYRWLTEKGVAIGCTKEQRAPNRAALGCTDASLFNLNCSEVISRETIRDLKECRRHLPTESAWLKTSDFQDCVATTGPLEAGGSAIVAHLPPSECSHRTVVLGEGCEPKPGPNLVIHPASETSLEELAPEILNLAQGATVPSEVYAKYDSRRIGLSLVRKIHQEMEKDNSGAGAIDLLNASEVQLAFRAEDIDRILKNGFLNQHQVGKSGGSLNPEHRALKEDLFLGYHLNPEAGGAPSVKANEVRPKYAYLSANGLPLEKDPMYRGENSFISANYGGIFAVFNPEVKDRTTFTMSDSFGVKSREEVRTLRAKPSEATQKAGTYLEAQVWGALTMRDVKHFLVNCPGLPQLAASDLERLKAADKPILSCRADKRYPDPEVPAQAGFLGLFSKPARRMSAEEREKAGVVVRVREDQPLWQPAEAKP